MVQTWTIQEVAKAAGTTSRTLRHYDAIGLLRPTEIAPNGYRLYSASALVRLQRILALRDMGMPLEKIRAVLDREATEIEALTDLEHRLVQESARLERQITTVRRTLVTLKNGGTPMAEDMFDGFKHEQYKDEVEERWGADAWKRSDDWWKGMSDEDRRAWQDELQALNAGWQQAHAEGAGAESDVAQRLAARHVAWLRNMPHEMPGDDFRHYVLGLGEMYVNDPRFAANYGGEEGATLVRDALKLYAATHL